MQATISGDTPHGRHTHPATAAGQTEDRPAGASTWKLVSGEIDDMPVKSTRHRRPIWTVRYRAARPDLRHEDLRAPAEQRWAAMNSRSACHPIGVLSAVFAAELFVTRGGTSRTQPNTRAMRDRYLREVPTLLGSRDHHAALTVANARRKYVLIDSPTPRNCRRHRRRGHGLSPAGHRPIDGGAEHLFREQAQGSWLGSRRWFQLGCWNLRRPQMQRACRLLPDDIRRTSRHDPGSASPCHCAVRRSALRWGLPSRLPLRWIAPAQRRTAMKQIAERIRGTQRVLRRRGWTACRCNAAVSALSAKDSGRTDPPRRPRSDPARRPSTDRPIPDDMRPPADASGAPHCLIPGIAEAEATDADDNAMFHRRSRPGRARP